MLNPTCPLCHAQLNTSTAWRESYTVVILLRCPCGYTTVMRVPNSRFNGDRLLPKESRAFEAGFIAGLSHQDKRIEALEAKLLAWERYNDGMITRRELAIRLMKEVTK